MSNFSCWCSIESQRNLVYSGIATIEVHLSIELKTDNFIFSLYTSQYYGPFQSMAINGSVAQSCCQITLQHWKSTLRNLSLTWTLIQLLVIFSDESTRETACWVSRLGVWVSIDSYFKTLDRLFYTSFCHNQTLISVCQDICLHRLLASVLTLCSDYEHSFLLVWVFSMAVNDRNSVRCFANMKVILLLHYFFNYLFILLFIQGARSSVCVCPFPH